MPVFGKEEPAASARQSSNINAGEGVPIKKRRFPVLTKEEQYSNNEDGAGVPIKKRGFPVLTPPSPPPQEPTSLSARNDSVDNKNHGTGQESSFMDGTIASNSVGKFDAVKNPFLEVKKEIISMGSNVNVSFAKPKETNLTTQFDVVAKSQLNLPPKDTIAVGENVISKQGPVKCKPEPFASTDEYALVPNEPLVPALMGQNREVNLYPSLSTSLSKEKCIDRSKNVENTVNNDTVVSANRSNWDLNTTMDAWGGSVGEAPPLDTVGFNGLNKIVASPDTSSSAMSQSKVGVNVDLGKQILGGGDYRPDFPVSSLPSSQYRAEDLLHLSLSPSFTRMNFRAEPAGSSTGMPSGSSAGMPFASLCNLASGSLSNLASGSSDNKPSGSSTNIAFRLSANIPSGSPATMASGSSADMNSGSSARVNSNMAVDYSKLLGQFVSTKNSTAGLNVKPEPSDGIAKHDSVAAKGNSADAKHDSFNTPSGSSDNIAVGSSANVNFGSSAVDYSKLLGQDSVAATVNSVGSSTIVKKEVVERCKKNDFEVPNAFSQNVVEDRPIKSEPTQDINKGTPILTESIANRLAGAVLQSQENVSLTTGAVLMSENSCSSVLPSSFGLSSSSDVANQEHSAEKADIPAQDRSIVSMCNAEDSNAGELQSSRGNTEAFGSDDEKINISTDMMEEDSYGSDSESDGHATKGTRGGKEEEDYEDGEIRELLVQNATVSVPTDEREGNAADHVDCENSNLSSLGLIDTVNLNQDPVDDKDCGNVVGEDHIKECVDSSVEDRSDQILDKGVTFQEQLAVEVGPAVTEAETFSNETQRRLDRTQELSGGGKLTETETTAVGEVENENAGDANENDEREKEDLCLPTTDSSLSGQQDAAKDTDSGGVGGGRSRIITLPRASNVVSPSKTRSILDCPFEWGTRKERYTDFEGDKLHLRRNRDDMFAEGPRRFVRDRFQDQPFRGSRTDFVRGRGRAYNRFDRSEWVSSGRKFNSDNYSGQAEYRFSRNKHSSASDEELESDSYPLAQDGDLVGGSGRGGRKPLSDDFASFRNQASRRLSPRGRGGGPTTRGIQMVRRIARNVSPNGEEVGNRYGDKFTINLPDDTIDPVFSRSQHANEGLEDQFPRGNRKFSFVQRRGIPPRFRSKSPMRTRTRSPGPWLSPPRRRSPDGYNGIQELTRQRRSPPIYRMERVRSPPLNFPDEIVSRRRGSPPYIAPRPSNDFQRPVISNRRSPSDRPVPRNNRRFDNSLDPQERANSGEYFEGPIRASRFHEIGEEATGDDRRRLSERRGGRGFGGENFRFRQEGGPRPFRFGPKGDSEFVERTNNSNNLRERDFDRRIKNRPVIGPSRRMRGVEEQESDFRQVGPVWHDDSFGDASSRGKRRRF